MVKEIALSLTPKQAANEKDIYAAAAKHLGIKQERINHISFLKKALDARKRIIKYHVRLMVYVDKHPEANTVYYYPNIKKAKTIVPIIGAGPAGLFAALELIKGGCKPLLFERGKAVEERKKDIALLQVKHLLNKNSNYCFGEGGAGTFSDGKLYTRSKKRGNIKDVLNTFVAHGAPQSILYDSQPHIGSDILPGVIRNMRNTILNAGGEIVFNSSLSGIVIKDNCIKSIIINADTYYDTSCLILACGHSARDIYRLLQKEKIHIEAKPFAVGLRVEHPQDLINRIQYKSNKYSALLPPASYKLVAQVEKRAVFSFCMCPGGIIVPSATAPGQVVVNGMSNSKRNSPYANSGIVVQVNPEDVPGVKEHGALHLMAFQEDLERSFFTDEEKPQTAPAQRLVDFLNQKESSSLPPCSYYPGVKSRMLEDLLPQFIGSALKEGLKAFDKKMKGFVTNEALLLGVESRSSSPVRITRKAGSCEHIHITGLYPCGEGAGYAGGITSSAIDGINAAKEIAGKQ